eukprot:5061799-Prymnesium_polylepis.1
MLLILLLILRPVHGRLDQPLHVLELGEVLLLLSGSADVLNSHDVEQGHRTMRVARVWAAMTCAAAKKELLQQHSPRIIIRQRNGLGD